MKKYNTDKLKKIHIYPVILALIVVAFAVFVAIALLAESMLLNMTSGKTVQG